MCVQGRVKAADKRQPSLLELTINRRFDERSDRKKLVSCGSARSERETPLHGFSIFNIIILT